ncbi:MAG: tryptophan-rich sensory protein [Chitinophagaceae bacterium]|nr:tryptophan-rich sensory protein [Chitinophagaceae bacterium]MBL0057346.1 tryptophan-rich sensory protein [Chitinophagaceae bacterium]
MKLFISLLIPLAVGAFAGLFTSSGVNGWYASANKPGFNPPNWIFAPVWTGLYIMMGIALFLVWRSAAAKELKQAALILFAVQLLLNFAWSFIFFKLEMTGWALVEMIMMWVMILLTILWFGKISPVAAWLLVPYISWVSFAAVLNYSIWKLN